MTHFNAPQDGEPAAAPAQGSDSMMVRKSAICDLKVPAD
jgi:hypothetical protein